MNLKNFFEKYSEMNYISDIKSLFLPYQFFQLPPRKSAPYGFDVPNCHQTKKLKQKNKSNVTWLVSLSCTRFSLTKNFGKLLQKTSSIDLKNFETLCW